MDKNRLNSRNAFTLIEVMVAVMIISVVVMALLQMRGNNTHIFLNISNKVKINQYLSFFVSNKSYGFEKKSSNLNDLLSDFDLEDELRRKVKDIKVNIVYQEVQQIDLSEFDTSEDMDDSDSVEEENTKDINSNMLFEIGRTVLKIDDSSASLLRLRIQ